MPASLGVGMPLRATRETVVCEAKMSTIAHHNRSAVDADERVPRETRASAVNTLSLRVLRVRVIECCDGNHVQRFDARTARCECCRARSGKMRIAAPVREATLTLSV